MAAAESGMSTREPRATLPQLRSQLDILDSEILHLVNKRAAIVRQVRELKAETGIPLRDKSRERDIVRRLIGENEGPLSSIHILLLWNIVFAVTLNAREKVDEDGAKTVPASLTGESDGDQGQEGRGAVC